MNEEQVDRALKIAQLIETCAKMGGVKAFEPITKLAHEALRELNEELAPEPEPYEEVEVEGVVGDNPPPAAREADGIDNDDDGEIDEPDEELVDETPPVTRRP